MYYSSRIRGQTVPQNIYYTDVCTNSPGVAQSPPTTQDHNTRLRHPAAHQWLCHLPPWKHPTWPQIITPQLNMSIMKASGGSGSFLPLSFPLFWVLKHDPSKMRVGDGGSPICGSYSFLRSNNQPKVLESCQGWNL